MDEEVLPAVAPDESCAGQRPRALVGAAATVPVFHEDTEAPVLGQQQWECVHERRARGQSISAIARDLELDRKTVRTCLAQPAGRPYCRPSAPSVLDAHRLWLAQRAPEVNFSARILRQELRAQGFTGSYVVVRRAVAPIREEASVASLTQRRFEPGPGEQAQCDWGQVTVPLSGVRTELYVFVKTLGNSRRGFAQGFEHERIPNVLNAHEAAFAHFGGRCEFLLYDRMRTAVLGQSKGRPRLNPTFVNFAAHWGFTPPLCQPYRAQTKGKVESGVKYVKRNFLPGRSFVDLDDFDAQLAAWQTDVADVRVHGTTLQRPIDRFAEEARALAPTAGQASFLQACVRDRVVADDWLVSIDANRYSVPFTLIGKTVQVVRQGSSWVIRFRGAVVAKHVVLAGRAQLSVQPQHGPGAVARTNRRRCSTPAEAAPATPAPEVEVRDLLIYEQLGQAELLEVSA